MINRELSSIFEDLADMEEIQGNRWESLAYRKVARNISLLSEDVLELYRRKELRKIDGVGTAIEKKIIEFIETGKVSKHQELKEKFGIDFESLRNIQGLGPKRIVALSNALGVKNLDDLVEAIHSNKVSEVPGFGLKSQESLNKSIELYLSTGAGRRPIAICYDEVRNLAEKLIKSGFFTKVEIAGSTRRYKETIGDIDILSSSSKPKAAGEYFVSMEDVRNIIVKGDTKISVLLAMGLNCDLRIIEENSFGAALQYFTGSKEHNIKVRDLAINAGMKLNEYGLYKGESMVAGKDEKSIYNTLGMDWIPPELRENMGEIEAALQHKLPALVEFTDVRGDFHVHTDETDGFSTLEEMIQAAIQLGYDFIAITEHSQSLKVANGMDVERFRKRNAEIDSINEKGGDIRVLKGVELEILKDGSLDLPKSLLEEMDVVIGALHQGVSDKIEINTMRMVKAIESGLLTTIAHPTGRLIGSREPYKLDFEKIFQTCKDNNVALEINGFPTRSDLPFDLVKKAKEYHLKFTLGSDSHSKEQLKYLTFATAIARRGWLENWDI